MFQSILMCRPEFSGVQELLGRGVHDWSEWKVWLKKGRRTVGETSWFLVGENNCCKGQFRKQMSFFPDKRHLYIHHDDLLNKILSTLPTTSVYWTNMSSKRRSGISSFQIFNRIGVSEKSDMGIRSHDWPKLESIRGQSGMLKLIFDVLRCTRRNALSFSFQVSHHGFLNSNIQAITF